MSSGAFIATQRCIDGPAGAVLHALKRSHRGFVGFGEAYFSEINEGAVKSWRRHRTTTVNLVVPHGCVRFVVHDEPGREFEEYRLGRSPDFYARLTVPPGLWFAFQGVGPGTSLILSIIDQEHDPTESEVRELASLPYNW